jgi:hypothetical protein
MNIPRNVSYILSLYDIVVSNNEYDRPLSRTGNKILDY